MTVPAMLKRIHRHSLSHQRLLLNRLKDCLKTLSNRVLAVGNVREDAGLKQF